MSRTNPLKFGKAGLCVLIVFLGMFQGRIAQAQTVGISTNALGWLALSPNIGVDVGFAGHWSAGLDVIGNPFSFSQGRKLLMWGLQPEVRYWPRASFAGHAFGVHGQYGQFDIAVKDNGRLGYYGGAGVSYGYAYMLSEHWNVEASIGFGYNRVEYVNTYDRLNPMICHGASSRNYWGITKLGVKFTYYIKLKK